MCKHLHFTQAEVVLVPAVVPDVHVAPLVSETIVTGEQNAWVLETTFEGGAGFVQRLALGQQLNDEYGELLICICKRYRITTELSMTDTSLRYRRCFNPGIPFVSVLQGSNSQSGTPQHFVRYANCAGVFKS